MIPYSAAIRIRNEHCRGRQTWVIPFWLVGLLLLPMVVLLLPFVIVASAIARINPFPILHAFCQIFVSLKGTIVEVDDPQFSVSVHVS